ncbi:MAG: glucose-6-phosphate dehydrogenase [Chloroflexi bacterium]|nr:glucose-6-phosphate dehydrogenase [Chloroflexota bacterium]
MPTTIIIFGASGDLTRRKLVPALYDLAQGNFLPPSFAIMGTARSPYSDESFRTHLHEQLDLFSRAQPGEVPIWDEFAKQVFYHPLVYDNAESYKNLGERLAELEQEKAGNRLFYLATPPQLYETIIRQLGAAGLSTPRADGDGWSRIIVEKPFGHDLPSARTLNATLHQVFDEQQIYRIDHYLGKETVQDLIVFRFANTIFEPVWNRNYVDHVQITVAEQVDVASRAGYYDQAGVMRDMFQNHLLQLLTLTAMEPPAVFDPNALRDEKVKVLRALRAIPPDQVAQHTIRAQYRRYRDEEGVSPGSNTPTYALVRLHVDNWRWQGVPFYLRSGKALADKRSEIIIQFKCPPHTLFLAPEGSDLTPNRLALCIQPDEGMHLRFETKVPGAGMTMRSTDMEFHYGETFGAGTLPSAYERLLLDALHGDPSLFTRGDEIELAWSLIDPILEGWSQKDAPALVFYEAGTWGPPEADAFLAADHRRWHEGCRSQHEKRS